MGLGSEIKVAIAEPGTVRTQFHSLHRHGIPEGREGSSGPRRARRSRVPLRHIGVGDWAFVRGSIGCPRGRPGHGSNQGWPRYCERID